MYCVETKNIHFSFSNKEEVLSDINLKVLKGSIYGFLGPNGAGKTTTLKLITGLLNKQKGEMLIFGKSLSNHRVDILKEVGTLIESPSLYGHLTASENLQIVQKIYQCPIERINEVLALVGLLETGKKKVSQFSLGMKQRLSIAIALLNNPALLILDEPTNGLDPNGIFEIRALLLKLNREHGTTMIISSHLLSEVEKLANYIGIINKGKMQFQGTLNELKDKQNESSTVVFDTNDIEKSIDIIQAMHKTASIQEGKIIVPYISKKQIALITEQLVKDGIGIFEVSMVKNDLESIFMNLIHH